MKENDYYNRSQEEVFKFTILVILNALSFVRQYTCAVDPATIFTCFFFQYTKSYLFLEARVSSCYVLVYLQSS